MKIKELHNLIEEQDNVFICDVSQGVAVCSIIWEANKGTEIMEIDHCSCLNVSTEKERNEIKMNIITEKTDIEEFIIIHYREDEDKKLKKIKFVRK